MDRATEFLGLEQPLGTPRRLDVVLVGFAIPDVAIALAQRLDDAHVVLACWISGIRPAR
jgi:hypothetical protein